MRKIEIDEDIYEHLCRNTAELGETASSILRRLLGLDTTGADQNVHESSVLSQSIKVLMTEPAATIPITKRLVEQPHGVGQSARTEGYISPRVAQLLLRLSRLRTRQVVDRFIVILAWIHEQEPEKFECAQQIRGRTRIYFSRTRSEIEESGKSTFPVEIETTGWFVSTNNSTPNKREILDQLLRLLAFPETERDAIVQVLDPDSEAPIAMPRMIASRPIEDDDDLKI
jgi:negative modulator of initiation of replication